MNRTVGREKVGARRWATVVAGLWLAARGEEGSGAYAVRRGVGGGEGRAPPNEGSEAVAWVKK